MNGTRKHGTIARIIGERGFGFILPQVAGRAVFFHASELTGDLEFGEQLRELSVTFDLIETEKGPVAKRIEASS